MMKYPLNSSFSERITGFVDYKHSLGHSYEESCRILWKFDLFVVIGSLKKAVLTETLPWHGWKCEIRRAERDTGTALWFCGNLPGISMQLGTQLI